jgi:hypothetical protein
MVSLSDIKERAQQAVSTDGDDDDSSTAQEQEQERIDQKQARIERAREEAREQARRQKIREDVQEEVEAAREEGAKEGRRSASTTFERVSDAIQTATERVADTNIDDEMFADMEDAFGQDFDGDGQPFGSEIGLGGSPAPMQTEQSVTRMEAETFGQPNQQLVADADRMSPGGLNDAALAPAPGSGLQGGLEPIAGISGLQEPRPQTGGGTGGLSGSLAAMDSPQPSERNSQRRVEDSVAPTFEEMGLRPEDQL